jgi:tetratricopeptide (TPR) repeat protein
MGHIHTTRAFILGLSKAKRRREFELALKELEKLERTGVLETVPKKKLLVLTKKGEVLMRLERWVEALKVNEVCDALHEEGRNNKGQMQKRLNDLNCAGAEGRYEDSMEIIWELKGKVADDPLLSSIDTSIFRLYFCIVKCKEEIGDYRGALVFYKYKIGPAMKHMIKQKGHTSELHEKNFHMNMGLAKCMYHLGEYRHSIGAGLHAVKHDRSFRQVHKYVALSFRATGNPEAAIQFMAMAINYEIPWDEENRQVNLKLYEEMIRDASKKKI